MSGGVDSSVAAARLLRRGVRRRRASRSTSGTTRTTAACAAAAAPRRTSTTRAASRTTSASRTTRSTGASSSAAHVVDPFVDAYLAGETPSPCVACNRAVKLRELFPLAERLGAAFVATGHYARVRREGGRRAPLPRRATDRKDQSYFLHMLRERRARAARLPARRRDQGRGARRGPRARAAGRRPRARARSSASSPPAATTPSSRSARRGSRCGRGRSSTRRGGAVGRHEGVHRFTIGQRKGLGVALGRPVFVVGARRGDGHGAPRRRARALRVRGAHRGRGLGRRRALPPRRRGAGARAPRGRARDDRARGGRGVDGEVFVARFHAPVRAISPGQVAVAYLGDRVLGGGTITAAGGARVTRAFLVLAGARGVRRVLARGGRVLGRAGHGRRVQQGPVRPPVLGDAPVHPDGTAVGACYDLQPDFFAAEPYRSTLQIRLQRGSDLAEFSDGLMVLIDDVPTILAAIAAAQADAGAADAGGADAGTDGGAADGGTAAREATASATGAWSSRRPARRTPGTRGSRASPIHLRATTSLRPRAGRRFASRSPRPWWRPARPRACRPI